MRLGKQLFGVIGSLALMTGSVMAGDSKHAEPQTSVQAANQKVANDIAVAIASAIPGTGYTVDLEVRGGVATIRGTVSSPTQMKLILDTAKKHRSVNRVANELRVAGGNSVKAAGYQESAPPPNAMPSDAMPSGQALSPIAPEFTFPSGATPQYDMPFMPPFAWPAHAPYPNYSAVQYPKKYPARAWPYIGPFAPYPEAPLDWREVKMVTFAGFNPIKIAHPEKQPPPEWQCVSLKWQNGRWYYRFHQPWWSPRCLIGGLKLTEPADPCHIGVELGGYHLKFKQPYFGHFDVQ